ncbi:MAG TPA: hypothetical protein DEP50_07430 [Acinetobacter lwoffii]|nr:hypothetical protein [Acinetobacter lwoffii]
MSKISEFIQTYIGAGVTVVIAYSGGSRPGAARDVIPISCTDFELEAVEPGVRIKKRYKLVKVLWACVGSEKVINDQMQDNQENLKIFDSLSSCANYFREEFISLGWFVHEDDGFFGVGCHFKNGKPKKSPSIGLSYVDRSTELSYDADANDFVEVKRELTGRERPWRVDSWRLREGKTFSLLSSAVQLFLREIRDSDPKTAKGMFAGP